MYEIDGILTPYFSETDPEKRLIILDKMPDNEALNFIREVYEDRYSDHEKKGRKNVDWWLWRCICLQLLYGRGSFFIFKAFKRREINRILDELRMNDTNDFHIRILYHEYRNTARRYLSTCKSSGYASSFMGFKQADDKEKIYRACQDIWQMSKGIAISESLEIQNKMKVWINAFHDELMDYDDICRDEYERLDRN